MEVKATYRSANEVTMKDGFSIGLEYGAHHQILVCPACSGVVLLKSEWNDFEDPSEWPIPEVLYPVPDQAPDGLPDVIAKAVEAARRVRSIDPNAYGVLIGRVLELMCRDQKAEGKTLSDQLNDLARKGMIPSGLVSITKLLRQYRNVAAHTRLGALSPAEVPVLNQLTRAILEYVYSAPALAERALKRLENLQRETSEPEEED